MQTSWAIIAYLAYTVVPLAGTLLLAHEQRKLAARTVKNLNSVPQYKCRACPAGAGGGGGGGFDGSIRRPLSPRT